MCVESGEGERFSVQGWLNGGGMPKNYDRKRPLSLVSAML